MNNQNAFLAPDAKILVVADEKNANFVKSELKMQVTIATNAEIALKNVQETVFHAILIFITPELFDAFTLLEQIRKSSVNKTTPAIAIAQNGQKRDFYRNKGFQDSLYKLLGKVALEASLVKYLPPELLEFTENS